MRYAVRISPKKYWCKNVRKFWHLQTLKLPNVIWFSFGQKELSSKHWSLIYLLSLISLIYILYLWLSSISVLFLLSLISLIEFLSLSSLKSWEIEFLEAKPEFPREWLIWWIIEMLTHLKSTRKGALRVSNYVQKYILLKQFHHL